MFRWRNKKINFSLRTPKRPGTHKIIIFDYALVSVNLANLYK